MLFPPGYAADIRRMVCVSRIILCHLVETTCRGKKILIIVDNIDKCSDSEVKLPALLGNYDKQTDQTAKRLIVQFLNLV